MNLTLRNGMPVMPIGPIASPLDHSGTTELGVYAAGETKQRHALGRRTLTWDGRVFRYAKCGTTFISTTFGLKNNTILVANRTGTAVAAPADTPAGATKVTLACTATQLGDSTSTTDGERTGVIAKDELAGGYVHFQTTPADGSEHDENRMIVGNDALAVAGDSLVLYLDAPLNYALVSGDSTSEIIASPYANVARTNDEWTSVVGMPNVVATAAEYLWLQTWGPIRISPDTDSPTQNQRQYVFQDWGQIVPSTTNTTADAYQHAGFLIERTVESTYYHGPFIMLQISP